MHSYIFSFSQDENWILSSILMDVLLKSGLDFSGLKLYFNTVFNLNTFHSFKKAMLIPRRTSGFLQVSTTKISDFSKSFYDHYNFNFRPTCIDTNCGNYVFFQKYVKINEDQKQLCKGLITEDKDDCPLKSEKHQV